MSQTDFSSGADRPSYSAQVNLPDEIVMSYLADGNHDALAVIFDRHQWLAIRVARFIPKSSSWR
jgi:hypothetical protein